MKKLSILLLAVIMGGALFAQSESELTSKLNKEEVSKFINETNTIIKKTSELVKKEEKYTGGVVKGVEFQKQAVLFFKSGKLQKAMNNSFKARKMTFIAYKANSEKPIVSTWKLTDVEKKMVSITFTKEKANSFLSKEIIGKEKREISTISGGMNNVK